MHIIAAIRDVDPDAIDADLLLTRNLLQQRRPTDAQVPVRRVLAKQPKQYRSAGPARRDRGAAAAR